MDTTLAACVLKPLASAPWAAKLGRTKEADVVEVDTSRPDNLAVLGCRTVFCDRLRVNLNSCRSCAAGTPTLKRSCRCSWCAASWAVAMQVTKAQVVAARVRRARAM